jgi:hypothetical protein
VRVYEVLLRAVFDSLDEAEYVPDKDIYLQLLEVGWWPRDLIDVRWVFGGPGGWSTCLCPANAVVLRAGLCFTF